MKIDICRRLLTNSLFITDRFCVLQRGHRLTLFKRAVCVQVLDVRGGQDLHNHVSHLRVLLKPVHVKESGLLLDAHR